MCSPLRGSLVRPAVLPAESTGPDRRLGARACRVSRLKGRAQSPPLSIFTISTLALLYINLNKLRLYSRFVSGTGMPQYLRTVFLIMQHVGVPTQYSNNIGEC